METIVLIKIGCTIKDTVTIVSGNVPAKKQLREIAKVYMRKRYGDAAVVLFEEDVVDEVKIIRFTFLKEENEIVL